MKLSSVFLLIFIPSFAILLFFHMQQIHLDAVVVDRGGESKKRLQVSKEEQNLVIFFEVNGCQESLQLSLWSSSSSSLPAHACVKGAV